MPDAGRGTAMARGTGRGVRSTGSGCHHCGALMKFLIVNADDFGASRGINRGILEAHRRGILTSTSLMVKRPWSAEAAALGREAPELSIGLHVQLDEDRGWAADRQLPLREELRAQFQRFEELMGRLPTQIDSHHNVHRDPN